jgi:hypothetical protein
MASRTGNNKQVPDKMSVAEAACGKKRKTTRVSNATA